MDCQKFPILIILSPPSLRGMYLVVLSITDGLLSLMNLLNSLFYLFEFHYGQAWNNCNNMCKFWKTHSFYYSNFTKHCEVSELPGVKFFPDFLKAVFKVPVHLTKSLVKLNAKELNDVHHFIVSLSTHSGAPRFSPNIDKYVFPLFTLSPDQTKNSSIILRASLIFKKNVFILALYLQIYHKVVSINVK